MRRHLLAALLSVGALVSPALADGAGAGFPNVGGFSSAPVVFTPTVSAATYANGRDFGGIWTLSNAVRGAGKTARLVAITMQSKSGIKPSLDVYIWRASPTGTTTNGSLLALADADAPNFAGIAHIVDCQSDGASKSTCQWQGNIPLGSPVSGTSFFATGLVQGGLSVTGPASSTDVTFGFLFDQD